MYSKMNYQNFYIFIFAFWYGAEMVFNTTIKSILGIRVDLLNSAVNGIVFVLLMFRIVFMQSYKKKELVAIILITLPIIISTGLSGNRSVLSAWMFIVGAKEIRLERIIRIAYTILLVMIPLVILLRLGGFIDDYIVMRGTIQRYSLGFSHPNQLGLRIFQLVVCHCYLNRKKLSVLSYLNIIFSIAFTIIVPNSQTCYISLIVFLVLMLIYRYVKSLRQIYIDIFALSLAGGAVLLNILSIFLAYIDVNRNAFLSQIDQWMSSRFSWCHRVWQIYGVSFWGQKVYISEQEVKLVGITKRLWLDNSYANILLRYGILLFLIISVAYICLMRRMIVRKEYVLVIVLFLYSVYGLMENSFFMLSHNIFLIAISDLLYHKTGLNAVENDALQFAEG